MKILHVFTDQNYVYVEALVRLFYSNFQNIQNDFLICARKNTVPASIVESDSENRIYYLKTTKRMQVFMLSKLSIKYDYVIYHFLPNDIILHLYYYFHHKALDKVIWRIWGADLYNWKKTNPIYLAPILNYFRGKTRSNIKYIIPEPMDIPEYTKQFGAVARILEGPDPKGYDSKFLERYRSNKKENCYKILIGHSAVRFDEHLSVIDSLAKFGKENIHIILPLNYGDVQYAEIVSQKAINVFGNKKVTVIRDRMDLADYVKLMWECDALIIQSDRQIAMGNITMMLYMGKKIFIKGNSIMWDYYRVQEKLNVFDSLDISESTYEDFSSISFETDVNKRYAIEEIEIPNITRKWQRTFNYLIKEARQ